MNIKTIMAFAVFAAVLMFSSAAFAEDAFFEVKMDKPSFMPSEITVKKGQKVTIKFTSLDVDHSVDLTEFGLKEILVPEKQSVTVEFTPAKTGVFPIPCKKYCGWRHLVGKRPHMEIKVVE